MGLDIRLPIGLLFTIIGVLLAGFGAFGSKLVYGLSLGYNVNLDWGLVLPRSSCNTICRTGRKSKRNRKKPAIGC